MRKVISATIVILIILLGIRDLLSKRTFFYEKINVIEELKIEPGVFYSAFRSFYIQNGQYPLNLTKDLIDQEESEDLRIQFRIFFNDPFKDGSILHYIPFKNDSGLIEGYCLLSVGPDGDLNNEIIGPILLNQKNKIKLYDTLSFNYLNFYFGSKDLLVTSIYNK